MLRDHKMTLDVNHRQATLLVRRLCPPWPTTMPCATSRTAWTQQCATIRRSGRVGPAVKRDLFPWCLGLIQNAARVL